MEAHERAGQPATDADLVDVAALVTAYYVEHLDPAEPGQLVAFGTSGHRGSAFRLSFNEDHIAATTQAICEYRARAGITGPVSLARDTHALSEPALVTALEVLAANGVSVLADSFLVSGESLVRNLEVGMAQARRFGRAQLGPEAIQNQVMRQHPAVDQAVDLDGLGQSRSRARRQTPKEPLQQFRLIGRDHRRPIPFPAIQGPSQPCN